MYGVYIWWITAIDYDGDIYSENYDDNNHHNYDDDDPDCDDDDDWRVKLVVNMLDVVFFLLTC